MNTNISENKVNIKVRQEKNATHSLDTIQVTCDKSITETRIRQHYKGLRKDTTNTKLAKIEDITRALKYDDTEIYLKRYERTRECLNIAIQDGDNLIQGRCNQARLCQNCARAESSQRIEDFKTSLTTLAEDRGLFFVTLTAPTCQERQLKSTIERRIKAFARVKRNIRKTHGVKLNGLRKLEVTYNKETDRYHPHFHFLVQGAAESHLLRDLWLNQFRDASIKAQDIREIKVSKDDTSNLVEVFKYATKGIVKDTIEAHAEYHILRAINKKRIFQTFGELKKVYLEKISDTDKQKNDWSAPKREIFAFENKCKDWTDARGNRLVNLESYQVKRYENINKEKNGENEQSKNQEISSQSQYRRTRNNRE